MLKFNYFEDNDSVSDAAHERLQYKIMKLHYCILLCLAYCMSRTKISLNSIDFNNIHCFMIKINFKYLIYLGYLPKDFENEINC